MLSSFVVPPSIAGSLCVPSLFRGTLAAGLLAFALAFAPLGTEGAVARGENANPPAAAPTAVTRFSDAALTAAAAYSEAHGGRGMLVIEGPFGGSDSAVKGVKGAMGANGNRTPRFERYVDGWNAERPHALASGTKSFSGVLAMAAIEDGLITSLDEIVSDTLIEWKDDPRKSTITVRHLLTLASGLEPNHPSLGRQGFGIEGITEGPGAERDGPIARRMRERMKERAEKEKPADRFAASVAIPAERAPGQTFRYGPSHFYAFGELLERKLRASNRAERTFFDYLQARVLRPCGIAVGIERFAPDAGNKPGLPGSGHLTAREWARFGEAMLTDALAASDAARTPIILRPESVGACMTPSSTNPAYGLTWWIFTGQSNETIDIAESGGVGVTVVGGAEPQATPRSDTVLDAQGKPVRIWMAAGAGGQRLYLLPDHQAVIVRFGAFGRSGRDYSDVTFLRTLLAEREP